MHETNEFLESKINAASELINKDNAALKVLIDELFAYAEQFQHPYAKGYANYFEGIFQAHSNQYEGARQHFEKSMEIARQFHFDKLLGASYLNLGSINMMKGELTFAIDCYLKSQEIAEKRGDQLAVGITHANLATIYGKYMNDIEQSLAHCIQAEKIYTEGKAVERLNNVQINMANCYMLLGKFEQAEQYAKNVVAFGEARGNYFYEAGGHQTLATIYLKMKDFERTAFHLEACKKAYKNSNIQFNDFGVAYASAELLYETNQTEAALTAYLTILDTYQLDSDIVIGINILKRVVELLEAKGFYEEAFKHQKKLVALNDIAFKNDTNQALQKQKVIFQTEKLESDYKLKLIKSEMDTLRAQMNPHFIFNSLSSINRYILKNETDEASDYLVKFSQLIRTVLDNARSETVSLYDELKTLQLYIDIEALRFGDKISYAFELEDDLLLHDIQLPPLLLQPYVENAIWHGLMTKESNGLLRIYTYLQGDQLRLEIDDNGIGREKAAQLKSENNTKSISHGLLVTENRINLYNETSVKKISVDIEDKYDDQLPSGTKIIFTFDT